MKNPFENFFKKKELRLEKINKAREEYVSWLEISNSKGWKIYCEAVDKKIENILKKMSEDSILTGDDLKKLQLALCVWKEVKRLPNDLETKAKGK